MAWHWLDAERFYEEAKRVLKPRGCLAVYGHNAEIKGNERIKNVFDTVYGELMQLDCLVNATCMYGTNTMQFSCHLQQLRELNLIFLRRQL